MADKKISELTELTTPDGTEELVVNDSGVSKKVQIDNLIADNGLSGDKIDGGTISNFTSTGIDDNATSTAITIDASENVGIGVVPTNVMGYKTAHLGAGSIGSIFRLEGATADSYSRMYYNNSDLIIQADVGNIRASTNIVFQVDGAEKLRIPPTGGITFNGDTAAANALDDYETGTWTPTIRGTSGNTYASLTASDCKYIKIGNSVTITGYIHSIIWSDITNGSWLIMEGLPYATSADNYSSVSFGFNNTNLTGGYVETNGVVYFVIGGSNINQINNSITGDSFMLSVTYILD